jgi:hypothetical protein
LFLVKETARAFPRPCTEEGTMADEEDKLLGKRKYSPLKSKEAPDKPPFEPDRVDRGLEADDTRPLYAAGSIHPTEELKFALDSDAPVGGDVPRITSPIEEADELDRELRGRERADAELDEPSRE